MAFNPEDAERLIRESDERVTRGAVERIRQDAADKSEAERYVGTNEKPGSMTRDAFWARVWQAPGMDQPDAPEQREQSRPPSLPGEDAAMYGAAEGVDQLVTAGKELETTLERRKGQGEIPVEDHVAPEMRPEVTYMRDVLGVAPPEGAVEEGVAALAQIGVGALAFLGTGAPGAVARGAGAVAARVAPKAAQTTTGKVATDVLTGRAATSFAGGDAFAFAWDEKRILVAMNEVPVLAGVIPDILASDDVDDPRHVQRLERALEGYLIGGALEGAVRGVIHYAKAVKAGRANHAIEAPNKAAVEDAIEEQVVREVVETDAAYREATDAEDAAGEAVEGAEPSPRPAEGSRWAETPTYAPLLDTHDRTVRSKKALDDSILKGGAPNPFEASVVRFKNKTDDLIERDMEQARQAAEAAVARDVGVDTPFEESELYKRVSDRTYHTADQLEGDVDERVEALLTGTLSSAATRTERLAENHAALAITLADLRALSRGNPEGLRTFHPGTMRAGAEEGHPNPQLHRGGAVYQWWTSARAEFMRKHGTDPDTWRTDEAAKKDLDALVEERNVRVAELDEVQLALKAAIEKDTLVALPWGRRAGTMQDVVDYFLDRGRILRLQGAEGKNLKDAPNPDLSDEAPRYQYNAPDVERWLGAASVSARVAGIDRAGSVADQEAFKEVMGDAWRALRYWQADLSSPNRRDAAFDAFDAVHDQYALQGDLLRNDGATVSVAPVDEAAETPQVFARQVAEDTRDAGRRAEDLMKSGIQDRGPTAPELTRGALIARKRKPRKRDVVPKDAGRAPGDAHVRRQDTEGAEGTPLEREYRPDDYDEEAARLTPVQVSMRHIETPEDYDLLIQRMSEKDMFPRSDRTVNPEASAKAVGYAADRLTRLIHDGFDQTFRLNSLFDPRDTIRAFEALAGEVQRLSKAAADDVTDATAQAQYARALHKFHGFVEHIRAPGMFGEGGRTAANRVSPFRGVQGPEGASEALRRAEAPVEENVDAAQRKLRDHRLIAKSGGIERLRDTAKGMAQEENTRGVLAQLRNWHLGSRQAWTRRERLGTPALQQTALGVMFSNYLSGPATHAANVISNTANIALRAGEDYVAGAFFGEFGPNVSGADARALAAERLGREVFPLLSFAKDAVRLSGWHMRREWRMATRLRDGAAVVDEQIKSAGLTRLYENATRADHLEETARYARVGTPGFITDSAPKGMRDAVHGLGGGVGFATTGAVTSALQAEDVFFKTVAQRMALQRYAFNRVVREHGTSISKAERAELIEAIVRSPTDDMWLEARKQGELSTFTEDPHVVAQTVIDFAHQNPSVRFVVPFIRTPSNVVVQSMQRVPVLAGLVREHGMRPGELNTAAGQARYRARQAVGGLVMTAGVGAVFADRLSGGAPGNDRLRATREGLGMKDYAVKIGDTWIDYRQFGGRIGLGLGLVANSADLMASADTEGELKDMVNLAGLLGATLGYVVDETGLRNIGEILDIAQEEDPDRAIDRFARLAVRTGFSAAIPAGTGALSNAITRAMNEGVVADHTESGGMGGADEPLDEKVVENILRETNELKASWTMSNEFPRYNMFGEPVSQAFPEGTDKGWFSTLISSFSQNKFMREDSRPEAKAILELGYAVPRVRRELAVRETGEGRDLKARTIELNREQYAYMAKTTGEQFRKNMTRLIGSRSWKRYHEAWKTTGSAEMGLALRSLVSEAFAAANEHGRGRTMRKFEDLRERHVDAGEDMARERRAERRLLRGQ